MEQGEIILYQPDEAVKLDVRLEGETVWLTQAQIAELFGTRRQAITKHLKNIFDSEELNEESVCSILEHTKLLSNSFFHILSFIQQAHTLHMFRIRKHIK